MEAPCGCSRLLDLKFRGLLAGLALGVPLAIAPKVGLTWKVRTWLLSLGFKEGARAVHGSFLDPAAPCSVAEGLEVPPVRPFHS